ncbi:thiol-disulfide interchange protein DsbA precursor [Escherichia coli]|uniref:DsbA family protein n=1 Tax=Escherichia coli TaxID=562 RepID=UPI0019196683|nr:DsbA family protein [Escherichia coli]CAD5758100.1 thiol-disulfide interchange protein DsbA precursor [Escherichia coli]
MDRRQSIALCSGLLLAPSMALAGGDACEVGAVAAGRAERTASPVSHAADVVEFFSFYCPPCYAFRHQFGIDEGIRRALPPEKQMVKCHVDFLGALGPEMTHAWSVAMILGIEDDVEPLLFDAVQVKRSLKTPADIRAVFEKAGVDGAEYERLLDSPVVKEKSAEQRGLFKAFRVTGTPAVYVNGRYHINNGAFAGETVAQFRDEYVSVVTELLKTGQGHESGRC